MTTRVVVADTIDETAELLSIGCVALQLVRTRRPRSLTGRMPSRRTETVIHQKVPIFAVQVRRPLNPRVQRFPTSCDITTAVLMRLSSNP